MIEPASHQRLAENEVVFRQYNERVQNRLVGLKKLAQKNGEESFALSDDEPLYFYCECSDENCQDRIRLSPVRYTEIHEQRNQFVLVCGHETPAIEHIIEKEADFCVVRKFVAPPNAAAKLHPTDIKNT